MRRMFNWLWVAFLVSVGACSQSPSDIDFETDAGADTDTDTDSDTDADSDTDSDTDSDMDTDTDTDTDIDIDTDSDWDTLPDCDKAQEDCRVWGEIDAVLFAQNHVLSPEDDLFKLVSDREALIKVHVVSEEQPASSAVVAKLNLNEQTHTLNLSGPSTLPAAVSTESGVVSECFHLVYNRGAITS